MNQLRKIDYKAVIEQTEEQASSEKYFVGNDGLRRCRVCGEPVEAVIKNFPTPRRIPCACIRTKDETARIERERKEKREAAQRLLDESPLYDSNYRQFVFERDEHTSEDGFREAAKISRRFVERFDDLRKENAGILFSGFVGTGKTFYAAAITNALIELGIPALIVSTSRLLNTLQGRTDRQEVIDSLNQFPLVVLDDFGAERATDYAMEQLEAVLDARSLSQKPLIVTTNKTPREISDRSDLRLSRLFDRVQAMCPVVVPLVHRSLRETQSKEKALRARKILYGEDGAAL